MTQYAFYFDQSRCYDCKGCAVACKDWNQLEPGPEKWLRIFAWEEGGYLETRLKALFAPCYHCEIPACVEACANDAIFKEDAYGAVLVEQEKCVGCRSCYEACPYGAPQFATEEPGQKMSKCTMCLDRLQDGKYPMCVLSCPMRALDFGTLEEMREKYPDAVEALPEMPASHTRPSILFKPQAPRKNHVRLDRERALELMLNLDNGDMPENLPSPIRTELVMKSATVEEYMMRTRNDEG